MTDFLPFAVGLFQQLVEALLGSLGVDLGCRFLLLGCGLALGLGHFGQFAGLLCGQQLAGGSERIIGLSIAREAANAKAHIAAFANAWLDGQTIDESRIEVQDERRQTYGVFDEDMADTIRHMMRTHGVPMDGTYTGKAYCALKKLAKKEGWQNRKVLFIHTGGTPLFFDTL